MKHPFIKNIPAIYFLVLVALFSGAYYFAEFNSVKGNVISEDRSSMPSRSELRQAFYANRQALLIYGGNDPRFADQYRKWAAGFKARSKWIKFEIKSDQEAVEADLKNVTLYLLGTIQSNRFLINMSRKLPFKFGKQGFVFHHKEYRDSSDIFSLFYPNPLDPSYAVTIITGNSDAAILKELKKSDALVWGSPGDYRVIREQRTLLLGHFSQESDNYWGFDEELSRDFQSEWKSSLKTEHYRFHQHKTSFNHREILQIADTLEKAFQKLENFLGMASSVPVIDYHIYPTFEDKGLITGDTRLSTFDLSGNAVHSVIRPKVRGSDFVQDARLILKKQFGNINRAVLELGLAVYFSQNWRGKGFEYWASRIFLSGNALSLRAMLDNQMLQQESGLIVEPLAGTFVGFLIRKWGREDFLKNLPHWNPGAQQIKELEKGWENYLSKISESYREQIALDRSRFTRATAFLKGFCFAHEGYQIYNGYLSQKSDLALEKLAAIGGNAISITPFSYMPEARKPVFLRHSRNAGSENDESVIHASLCAKELGMSVMLKPHLWLGRSWPGEIEMTTESDWKKFFGYYSRWILHYALLAEMYDIDILCIGVELSKTTIGREKQWIDLIGKIRKLYSGKLTYAANWGSEFENLSFWDKLDFIGLNSYYPLSKNDTAVKAELKAGVLAISQKIEAVHQRYGKPVIFTEIGFTSTNTPWIHPHKNSGRSRINLAHQKICYEAVFEGLQGKPWLRGIYWWKWPSYLEYGGTKDNDFTPNGKPAEKVVEYWFGKEWE